MFVAQSEQGQLVTLRDHAQAKQLRHQRFVCPACLNPVGIRNGELMPAHFYHLGPACQASEPESLLHLLGKRWLAAFGEAKGFASEFEVYYPQIKQRADVVWTRGAERLVLEYQCSPLSVAALAARTAGYRRLGLKVVWIAGPRYFAGWPTAKQAKFLHLTRSGFQLLFLDPQAQVLSRWRLGPDQLTKQKYWLNRQQTRTVAYVDSLMRAEKGIQDGLRYREPHVLALQALAAGQGLNVAGVPWLVHERLRHLPGLPLPEWQLRTRWLLAFQGRAIARAEEQAFWQQFTQIRTPLVPNGALLAAVRMQWLRVLVQAGALAATAQGWRWVKPLTWYATGDAKLRQLP